MHMSLHQEIV